MKADRAVFQDGGLGQGPGRVRQSLGEQAQAQPDTETASRRNVKRPSQGHESSRLTPQLSLDIQIEGAHHVQMGRGGTLPDTGSVFGTSRQLPQSYVPRTPQEVQLAAALSAGVHFVVWGEPRQGKSSLLRHQLQKVPHCIIQCAYSQRRFDVYRMILREAGASVAVERKRRRARGIGATVKIFAGNISSESETTERTFDIDISNINDVLRIIEDSRFDKVVVLDDFHYLGRSVQRQILQDMKAIYEKSSLMIVLVGIWGDRDQLLGLHMDLGGRVDAIEVPRWSENELAEVLDKGQSLLNLHFSPSARIKLIASAQQSIGVLQELAFATCLEATQLLPTHYSGQAEINDELVERAVKQVAEHSIARFRWYVNTFADPEKRAKIITTKRGRRRAVQRKGDDGSEQPYKGILHALLIAPDDAIRDGIAASDLLATIQNLYPFETAGLSYEELLEGLGNLGALHRAIRARPVLEYDPAGERVYVVDPLARLLLTTIDTESLVVYLPDEGRDIESDASAYRFAENVRRLYGTACAICPTTEPNLIQVVRLATPAFGYEVAPELGLPLCLNHARAWNTRLVAFEPETTKVMATDPIAINIVRADLTHLPVQPDRSALEVAWKSISEMQMEKYKTVRPPHVA